MAQEKIDRMFGSIQAAYDRLRAIVDSSYDGIYITNGHQRLPHVGDRHMRPPYLGALLL